MLGNRTAGKASRFTIPAVDEVGSKIEATSAAWALFDERGEQLATEPAADFTAGDDSVVFSIAAEHLNIAAGETSSGREIVVTLSTADGEVELRDYFILVASQPLAIMQNSFVTYSEAIRIRGEFASLDGWDAALRERQSAALAEAFRRVCKVVFKVPGANLDGTNIDRANYGTGTDEGWFWGSRVRISTLSAEQFETLPEPFRRAVKRAQLAEANILLGGDPVGKKREQGIISETTGESSMFFQSKPHLNLPISRQAYEEIKRYVSLRVGLLRG